MVGHVGALEIFGIAAAHLVPFDWIQLKPVDGLDPGLQRFAQTKTRVRPNKVKPLQYYMADYSLDDAAGRLRVTVFFTFS